MVKRYPHFIQIQTSTGSLTDGIWTDGTTTTISLDCNIQLLKKSYRDGSNEDSNIAKWRIFAKTFEESSTVKIGSKIIPVSGPTEFDAKDAHKIISFVIYQKHIEIEV